MNARKLFYFISLFCLILAYQNCGSGLMPGQEIDGFQSNGGGYSGVHSGIGSDNNSEPVIDDSTREPIINEPIDINNGLCTGKVMSYKLIDSTCSPEAFTENDFRQLLSVNEFLMGDEVIAMPIKDEAICKSFVDKFVFIIDPCNELITQVLRSKIDYIGRGTQVMINGLLYKSYGIQTLVFE